MGGILANSLNQGGDEPADDGYRPVSYGHSSSSSHSSGYGQPSSGYGHRRAGRKGRNQRRGGKLNLRGRRDAVESEVTNVVSGAEEDVVTVELEPVFRSLEANDTNDCAKAKICALATRKVESTNTEELALLKLFAESKGIAIASAKAPFDVAFRLGGITRDEEQCRKRYVRCSEY